MSNVPNLAAFCLSWHPLTSNVWRFLGCTNPGMLYKFSHPLAFNISKEVKCSKLDNLHSSRHPPTSNVWSFLIFPISNSPENGLGQIFEINDSHDCQRENHTKCQLISKEKSHSACLTRILILDKQNQAGSSG